MKGRAFWFDQIGRTVVGLIAASAVAGLFFDLIQIVDSPTWGTMFGANGVVAGTPFVTAGIFVVALVPAVLTSLCARAFKIMKPGTFLVSGALFPFIIIVAIVFRTGPYKPPMTESDTLIFAAAILVGGFAGWIYWLIAERKPALIAKAVTSDHL